MAVKQNDIRIGSWKNPLLALDNTDIISINGNLACDLLCEQIPVDTLEIQCRYDRLNRIFAPSDYGGLQTADGMSFRSRETAGGVPEIPYATGLWYFNDDKYIGKFYVSDAVRTGKYVYTITAVSAIGIMDGLSFYGKMLSNKRLIDAINDVSTNGLQFIPGESQVMADFRINLYVPYEIADVRISGWIPRCTRREALHHILFANGLTITKSDNGRLVISRVPKSAVGDIFHKNVYDSGSVCLTSRVKRIEVTEHSFVPNQNADHVVLYDNTETLNGEEKLVFFDSAPIEARTIYATGSLVIEDKNESCALVSGIGTLLGIPYSHTTVTISRENNYVQDGETISVSDATMVNALNSNAVADRLYDYYTTRMQMQVPIVLNGERCGYAYNVESPYGEAVSAYISAMSINASAMAKADCSMIYGYIPSSEKEGFRNVAVLTGSGVFSVPEEVFKSNHPRIRIVLIGGGQGGCSGYPGEDGPDDKVNSVDDLAKPGKPGKNGSAGKVYICDISDESLEATYSYSCGDGGVGGRGNTSDVSESNTGELGKDTLFGSYSSSMGKVSSSGYLDIMSGRIYAGPSKDYSNVIGGRGGGYVSSRGLILPDKGALVVDSGISASIGKPIGSICYFDGSNGGDYINYRGSAQDGTATHGSGSGGPCITQDIEGGKTTFRESGNYLTVYLGKGAKGENGRPGICPMEINAYGYGMGGIGGMGGSAGGGSGVFLYGSPNCRVHGTPSGGKGGNGGNGGNGAPGCILVYY